MLRQPELNLVRLTIVVSRYPLDHQSSVWFVVLIEVCILGVFIALMLWNVWNKWQKVVCFCLLNNFGFECFLYVIK